MPETFSRKGFIWVPKPYQLLNWSLKISGVTIPRNKIFGIKYSNAIKDEIGQCNIEINNNDKSYSYSGMETVEIYVDYSDATTMKWTGEIEKIESAFQTKGHVLKILGRHVSSQLMDITVTESYTNTDAATILDDIINGGKYTTNFSYTPISTGVNVTVNWENKPLWDCVVDLCDIAQYDCYVDTNSVFVFFAKGSVTNTTEAIVHNDVLSISGLGQNIAKVRNTVIVNGIDSDGTPIVHTTEDELSQSNYKVKEKIITDTSINTVADAVARGEAELAVLKDAETAGEVESLPLIDLNPGEKVWISYPLINIHDTYRVVKTETDLYSNPFKTKVWINSVRKIPDLFRENMKRDLAKEQIQNPEKMKFSFNMTFDDSSQVSTLTNLVVSGGVLKTSAGENKGTMISTATSTNKNIISAYIIPQGTLLSGNIIYYLSVNGGRTWEQVSPKTLYTFSTTGKQIRLKVEISSSSTELDSISVMYKT